MLFFLLFSLRNICTSQSVSFVSVFLFDVIYVCCSYFCKISFRPSQVLQSRNFLRSNKMLGSFKLDVATVWAQPGTVKVQSLHSLSYRSKYVLHIVSCSSRVLWLMHQSLMAALAIVHVSLKLYITLKQQCKCFYLKVINFLLFIVKINCK